MSKQHQITLVEATDKSGDRKYFVMVPQMVKYFCSDVYELALWITVKEVAGEDGYCQMDTRKLAALATMSVSKVNEARKHLVQKGLLKAKLCRPPDGGHVTWKLEIPDQWAENIAWRKAHNSIASRIAFRHEQQEMIRRANHLPDDSPHESIDSQGKTFDSQGDRKEEPSRRTTRELEASRDQDRAISLWHTAMRELEMQMTRATYQTWVLPLTPIRLKTTGENGGAQTTLELLAPNAYVSDWCSARLDPPIRHTCAGILGIPDDTLTITYTIGQETDLAAGALPLLGE